jgi:hypothetical protein
LLVGLAVVGEALGELVAGLHAAAELELELASVLRRMVPPS